METMVDLPSGRSPGSGAKGAMLPARRQSLEERDAFPVTKVEIQAPRIPENVLEGGATSSERPAKSQNKLIALAFVVVAAIGALAAVRLFIAASHDRSSVQE
jgi:hypothetical protein